MSCPYGKTKETCIRHGSSGVAALPSPGSPGFPTPSPEAVERMSRMMDVALPEITCEEDIAAVLAVLDRDAADRDPNWGCTKAHMIRSYLEKSFWRETPERMMHAMVTNTRVCCGCHQMESLQRKDSRTKNYNREARYRQGGRAAYALVRADGRVYISPNGRVLAHSNTILIPGEKDRVEASLRAGKPVPMELAARYPDLIEQYGI